MKHYISDVIGDGVDPDINPFRPVLVDLIPDLAWSAMDGRENITSDRGVMLVSCEPTSSQHTTVIADAGVEYLGEA